MERRYRRTAPANRNTKMASIEELQEELRRWKEKCDQANKSFKRKNLDRMEIEDAVDEGQKAVDALAEELKSLEGALKDKQDDYKEELRPLLQEKKQLEDKLEDLEDKFKTRKNVFDNIQNNLQVKTRLPAKNVNYRQDYTGAENPSTMDASTISYNCHIVVGKPYILHPGQAVLTFQDEEVAKNVIADRKHKLELGGFLTEVRAEQPQLEKCVKFEMNMEISNKKMKVSSLPDDLSEETLTDKLELAFYKSAIGGGEIQSVHYDRNTNSADITYLHNKVPLKVLKKGYHCIKAGGCNHEVKVEPSINVELNKLQMFSGVSGRSVLLTGIKCEAEDEDDIQDMIQIHFQKASNGGGEVEAIAFSQEAKKELLFEEDLK
ncbi:N-myc-interactor isoform X2 [Hyperolius riggenbachi]|uniref:N-myc-interactor isoform X2 n=1 Tax=Hyperolius riggenbachi TaxID=752182 RepID=UPI0035A3BB6A